jgi:hypothetical protein
MNECNLYDGGSGSMAMEYPKSEAGEILLGVLAMP